MMINPRPGLVALVCGSRDGVDDRFLERKLSQFHETRPIHFLVQGGALGVDAQAVDWASANGIHYASVPALWRHHIRSAGPIRNRIMRDFLQPDVVIAFAGGAGTANMISLAEAMAIEVVRME